MKFTRKEMAAAVARVARRKARVQAADHAASERRAIAFQSVDPNEKWRPIPGFPTYEVSDRGRVRTVGRRPRLLVTKIKGRWLAVRLWCDGKTTERGVGALVLEAFGQPRPENCMCKHRDRDLSNAALDNVYWGPRSVGASRREGVLADLEGGVPQADVARRHGLSRNAVWQYARAERERGAVIPKRAPRSEITEETRTRALELLRSGVDIGRAAAALGVSYETVFRAKKRAGLVRSYREQDEQQAAE